jgi:formylglycine-generating enzyme required for sulfatase activity
MRPSTVSLGMTASLLLWLVSGAPGAEPSLPPTLVGQDGAEMVLVPGGEFPMGSEAADIEALQHLLQRLPPEVLERLSDQAPKHRVYLDAFYIDKYEVTNALYRQFMQATGRLAPRLSAYQQFNQPQQPVVGVTWREAQAYCAWAGKRLPTEAEWEKAARGSEGRLYPWGNHFDGPQMNYCDKHCPFDWKDTAIDDGYARTAPVGSYEQGKSPYGAYDMAGNVWEWVADWYAEDYYQHSPTRNPTGPVSGERKVARGGAWFVPAPVARTAMRRNYDANYWGDNIGLRCALTPPPGQ